MTLRFILARHPSDRGEDTVVIASARPKTRHIFSCGPPATVQRGERYVYLPPMRARFMRVFAVHKLITLDQAAEAAYAERTDGGPDLASQIIRLELWRLKQDLKALDIALRSRCGQGYWLHE